MVLLYSLKQFEGMDGIDVGEIDGLNREVEFFKVNFSCEVYREVFDSDRFGDVLMMQMFFIVQFEMLMLLLDIFVMDEEQVVQYVKEIINKFL